ncbi:hypothetical protein FOA52_000391 [Chlamydomonas sp. UWO 241]|nr:hypothetical protein FOA52_000391 [Chlamydomonas sp. UWO 241]
MAPPGTSNRGGGSMLGGPAPGTAAGRAGQPPSTAYTRTGTAAGRPGTGSAGAAGARTGQAPTVDARPITNHGVSGMKTAQTAGGGRRVLDKNFFLSELRQKRSEIANVTQGMQEELEALEKRQSQYNTLEARGSDLSKEVKIQQEALADYNTCLDKVGSQTPVYSIKEEQAELKTRNEQQRKRVDEVLTERLQLEQKTKQSETKVTQMQAAMEERFNAMPPSQRQQYQDLLSEQQGLQMESKRYEDTIDELDKTLATMEGELARNPLKQRSLQLQEQIRTLTEKKYEQQQDEERSKQSPEEQREALMTKIQRDNKEVESITAQIKEAQEAIKKMDARVQGATGVGAPQINAAEEAARREKYEELVAKERDLNNFMDSFPSRRADKMQETRDKQDAIVGLLEKIAKLSSMTGGALPSQKKFKEMQDELEYKKMQLENTQMTQTRLREELEMRRTELDKIDTLEDKIKTELVQLDEKSDQLRKEKDQHANVGDVKEKAEATRANLEVMQKELLKRKDLLRMLVAEKAVKQQAKKAQLQENNLQIALETLEQKLRQATASGFAMSEFIKTKESETNYKGLTMAIGGVARWSRSRKETLLPLQISYAQAGYLTAAIDCRYHGERGIDPGVRHVATGAYSAALIDAWRGKTCERPFLLDNVFDVVHLLDVLCARGDVDAQRLGITGISLGGMHSWLAAVLDERIAAAAPMIGVQNFQWAIDHDQVQGRVSSLPALFAAASSDLGSQSPTPAVVSAVWARLLPRLLPRPAAVAGAAGATGASASEGASDAAVGAGGTADGRAVAAPTAAAGAAGAGPTDGAASAAAAAAAPVSAAAACYDAPASLPCIAPRALLVANGECDPRCPLAGVCGAMVGARAAYETAGCPERLELFVDVGRGHETSPQMQAAVRAWFDRWLLTSAAK